MPTIDAAIATGVRMKPLATHSALRAATPRGYARYVGRVGALAVALGVGVAVATGHGAGQAWAEPAASEDASTNTGAASDDSAVAPHDVATPGSDHDSDRSATDGAAADGPESTVSSSGGRDDSTNDEGQATDTQADAEDAPSGAGESPSSGSSAGDSGETPRRPAKAIEKNSNSSAASESAAPETDSPEADVTVPVSQRVAVQRRTVEPAPSEISPPPVTLAAPTARRAIAVESTTTPDPTARAATVTSAVTPSVAPVPSVVGTLLGIATNLVAFALAPFAAPGPAAPADPPLLWAVLGFVRRTFLNDTPDARNDVVTVQEDTPTVVDVLANDVDCDDPVEVTSFTQPSHGVVVRNADGSLTYAAQPDYTGTDEFTYTISDAASAPHLHGLLSLFLGDRAHADTATVRITVAAVNDAPAVVDDAFATNEDTPLTANVTANDSDADGDALTATMTTPPTHGTLTSFGTNGSFTYAPAPDFAGIDTFTYTVTDGVATETGTVTVTVRPVNDPPAAVGDAVVTTVDRVVTGNVLGNDTDPDGDRLTATGFTTPAHGTLTTNPDGSFTYTPGPGFVGTDSFSYRAFDGVAASDPAVVTITVRVVNAVPLAAIDAATTDEDTSATIAVLANDVDTDGDPLTVTVVGAPAHGTATVNADGTVTYRPAENFFGSDGFAYTVSDGLATSAPTAVKITVRPVDDAPAAVADTASTPEDTAVSIDVLANDSDVESATLSATVLAGPAHGTVTPTGLGSFTYTPNADFAGDDAFTYTLSDGTSTAVGTVAVTVTPTNDAPAVGDDVVVTTADVAVSGDLTGNDSDPDGDDLTARVVTPPANGTALVAADGTFVYTPNAGFTGLDTFTYEQSDGTLATAATVTVVVFASGATAPVAIDDSVTTAEDTPVLIDVVANDVDPDGSSLTTMLLVAPVHGTVSPTPGGYLYTPNPDFNGVDTFAYEVSDGTSNSQPAIVTVTVTPVDDAPTAGDDAFFVAEDRALPLNVLANDASGDGGPLTVTVVTNPTHGALVQIASGSGAFVYRPDADFHGVDTFVYRVTDTDGDSDTATVTITVASVNDRAEAVADNVTTAEDTAITIDVLANDRDADSDPLTATVLTVPAHGALVPLSNGVYRYTPLPGFNGTDTFVYSVQDPSTAPGQGAVTAVTIVVTPVYDSPVAVDDTVTVQEDLGAMTALEFLTRQPVMIDVLANDRADSGDVGDLTIFFTSTPAHGTINVLDSGVITYVPDVDFAGTDTFSYNVVDTAAPLGADFISNTATVTIVVTPIDDPIRPVTDTFEVERTESGGLLGLGPQYPIIIRGNVLTNDEDPDGAVVGHRVVLVSAPDYAVKFVLLPNGDFVYQRRNVNTPRDDSFGYVVVDGTSQSDVGSADIRYV